MRALNPILFLVAMLALASCASVPKYPHSDDPSYVPLYQYDGGAVFGAGSGGVYATVAIESDDRVRLTGFSVSPPGQLAPGTREAISIDPDSRKFELVFNANVPPNQYIDLASDSRTPFTTSVNCHGKERDAAVLTPCSSRFSREYAMGSYYFDPKRISALVSEAFVPEAEAQYQAAVSEYRDLRAAAEQRAVAEKQRQRDAVVQSCGALMAQDGARSEALRLAGKAGDRCAAQGIGNISLSGFALSRLQRDASALPHGDCDGVQQQARREVDLVLHRNVPWSQTTTPYLYYLSATEACR